MSRVFGPRTIVEVAFLVAVPVVAVVAGSSSWTIIAASAVGYLLVLFVEVTLWRETAGPTHSHAPPSPMVPVMPVVAPPLVPPVAAPVVETAGPADPVEPVEPVEPEAEPEPPPAAPPALTALPTLPPPPVPEPPAPAEPAPATNVVPLGYGTQPRQWSLWELETLAREHAGGDPVRDEERTFLLMYLRDFAGPDGALPLDFDALVRDSFGELLGT